MEADQARNTNSVYRCGTDAEQQLLRLLEQHPEWDDQQLRVALQRGGIQTSLRALRHKVYDKVLRIGTHVVMQQDKVSQALFELMLSRFAFVMEQDRDALKTVDNVYRKLQLAGDPIQKLAAAVLKIEYHTHRNHQLLTQEELSEGIAQLQEALDQTQRFVRLLELSVRWHSRYHEGSIRISDSNSQAITKAVIEQIQQIPAYETDPFPIPFLRWNTEALLWNIQGRPDKAVECYEQLIRYFWSDEQRPRLYPLACINALHNQIIVAVAARDVETVERRFAEIKQLRQNANFAVKDELDMLYVNVALYVALAVGMFDAIFDSRKEIEQILQQYRQRYPYFYKAMVYHLGCIAFWLQEYDVARHYLVFAALFDSIQPLSR